MLGGVGTNLDVGKLGGRDPDPTAPDIGEPEHLALGGDGLFDGGDELVAVGVLRQLDLDLLRRVGHTDPDFHQLLLWAGLAWHITGRVAGFFMVRLRRAHLWFRPTKGFARLAEGFARSVDVPL